MLTHYFSAWRYVIKEDSSYIESNGHPDLTNQSVPRTTNAIATIQSARGKGGIKRLRKTRMSVYDVSQLVVTKRIKN